MPSKKIIQFPYINVALKLMPAVKACYWLLELKACTDSCRWLLKNYVKKMKICLEKKKVPEELTGDIFL